MRCLYSYQTHGINLETLTMNNAVCDHAFIICGRSVHTIKTDGHISLALHKPSPELLGGVPGFLFLVTISLNLRNTRHEIHVHRVYHWRPIYKEPTDEIEDWEEGEWEVIRHKRGRVPTVFQEDLKTGEL
jgi:hypothetical protein